MPTRGAPHAQHIRPGDLVSHSEYGTGLVLRTRKTNWSMPHICEVLYRDEVHATFESGLRVVSRNMGQSAQYEYCMTHFKDSTLHVDESGIIVHSIPTVAAAYDKGWTSHHAVVPHNLYRKSSLALFVDHSNMIEYIFLPEESLLSRRIGEGIGAARPIIKSSAELKFKKSPCVLDVCAGLGAYSVAAMESGASKG